MSKLVKLRDSVAKVVDTETQKIGVDVVSRVLAVTGQHLASLSTADAITTIGELLRSGETKEAAPTKRRGRPKKAETAEAVVTETPRKKKVKAKAAKPGKPETPVAKKKKRGRPKK